MKTLTFKTNIKCGNCVAAVKPYLDADPAIASWQVDTAQPDKPLTVQGEHLTAEHVQQLLAQAGYEAQEKKSLLGRLFG